MLLWLIALVMLAATSLNAETIEGRPRVVDGDTLVFGMKRVRLHGIDAPETRQQCEQRDGPPTTAARSPRMRYDGRIGFRPVRCEGDRHDRYGRLIATCYAADGTDLNGWLVWNGHALAYRRYSGCYLEEESSAKFARVGMHAGRFVEPWRWRRGAR